MKAEVVKGIGYTSHGNWGRLGKVGEKGESVGLKQERITIRGRVEMRRGEKKVKKGGKEEVERRVQ